VNKERVGTQVISSQSSQLKFQNKEVLMTEQIKEDVWKIVGEKKDKMEEGEEAEEEKQEEKQSRSTWTGEASSTKGSHRCGRW